MESRCSRSLWSWWIIGKMEFTSVGARKWLTEVGCKMILHRDGNLSDGEHLVADVMVERQAEWITRHGFQFTLGMGNFPDFISLALCSHSVRGNETAKGESLKVETVQIKSRTVSGQSNGQKETSHWYTAFFWRLQWWINIDLINVMELPPWNWFIIPLELSTGCGGIWF